MGSSGRENRMSLYTVSRALAGDYHSVMPMHFQPYETLYDLWAVVRQGIVATSSPFLTPLWQRGAGGI